MYTQKSVAGHESPTPALEGSIRKPAFIIFRKEG